MSKILIITDSLGLPRVSPQKVLYEETYPHLFRADGHYVVQCSVGGATSKDLYRQALYYETFYPDYVFVSSGIVDCVPRALKLTEQYIINSNPITRNIFNHILPHISKFLRKHRNITYMKPKNFEQYIQSIVKIFPSAKTVLIGILPAYEGYMEKVPNIDKRISQYNGILKGIADALFFDTSNMPLEGIQPDFHHLTSVGHTFIHDGLNNFMD